MNDLRTAAQQALEALKYHVEQTRPIHRTNEAIDALRAALEKTVQEPVAMKTHGAWDGLELLDGLPDGACLYTAPPQQAEPVLQTCNCRWDGDVQVQQCTLHEAHVDAIHEWAERAKVAERKLAQQAEPDHETRAELAEQQVVQLAEERDHYRNLWQKAQQAEPQNTHSTECWRWHHKCAVAKIERECKHD